MRQRQSISGMGLLLAMMIVMVLVFRITGNMGEETPTQQDYIHAVEEGQVMSAVIRPNKETPTGELGLNMKDGRQWLVYVADVKEEQKFLMDQGIPCVMGNVPQESYLMSIVVPVLLSGVVLVVVILMMNARTAGGGANARMMNFGKSRAALILWRCLWAWELPESATCLRRPRRTLPVSCLSMRLTLWQDSVEPALAAATTRESRP